MDAGQLTELLLDLYEARPEAKEYLDFFAQPDIGKRLERAKTNIRKELTRTSRGRNRGRCTRVKRYIRDISSLNPGVEPVLELMTFTIVTACAVGAKQWVKESTQRAIGRLLGDTISTADRAGLLGDVLPQLREAVESIPDRPFYAAAYRNHMTEALDAALHACS